MDHILLRDLVVVREVDAQQFDDDQRLNLVLGGLTMKAMAQFRVADWRCRAGVADAVTASPRRTLGRGADRPQGTRTGAREARRPRSSRQCARVAADERALTRHDRAPQSCAPLTADARDATRASSLRERSSLRATYDAVLFS